MNIKPIISGIHHITAVTSAAAENVAFYEQVLGLRLVKKTVNFDDPYTYHLYYGDAAGTPGTILTFFPWEKLAQGRPGSGMVTAIAFAIPREAIDYWEARIQGTWAAVALSERFGERVLTFTDPHGLPLELITTPAVVPSVFWPQGGVPEAYAIAGFHSSTAVLPQAAAINALLTDTMGLTLAGQEENRLRFEMALEAGTWQYYDVVIDPQAPEGQSGSGTVHHIAFRTQDDASQAAWQAILREAGFGVTEVRDRNYFRSIYFSSPGGVLFEIATDIPGFEVDEAFDRLGAELKLPVQYEPLRGEIEKHLPSLHPETLQAVH